MEILRALQLARREWRNIKTSLEMCGDIGEFDSTTYINSRTILIPEGSPLFRSLIEMENRLPTYGYFTEEAAYVFTTLASSAAERLGLVGGLTEAFGRGYSWVRTGCFDPGDKDRQQIVTQLFFFKIFFPLGGFFNWDFNSPEVKTKLKAILYMFAGWRDNPRSYIDDVKKYGVQLEPLWRGLSLALGFPMASIEKKIKRGFPEKSLPSKKTSGNAQNI